MPPKLNIRYRPEFCQMLEDFFEVPPFRVSEVLKKDGSVALVESACELPTFEAFAHKIGTTADTLALWEKQHAAFAFAARKARDWQGHILIQNSLRGNYSASFAMFTAKNLLGWNETKETVSSGPLVVRWEKEND